MPLLIKNGQHCTDPWLPLADDATLPATGAYILSLARLESESDDLGAYRGDLGVRLSPDIDVTRLLPWLSRLALISIDIAHFSDGRAYSQATLLREQMGYRGELRACGDVIQDTVYYQQRCGFDALALRDDQDVDACIRALGTFTHPYQASVATPMLFQRIQRQQR